MHSSLSNGGSFVFSAALWWCSAVMLWSHSSALWVPSCLIICHRRPHSFDMPPAASQNRAGDYRRRGPFKASPRRSIIPFTPPPAPPWFLLLKSLYSSSPPSVLLSPAHFFQHLHLMEPSREIIVQRTGLCALVRCGGVHHQSWADTLAQRQTHTGGPREDKYWLAAETKHTANQSFLRKLDRFLDPRDGFQTPNNTETLGESARMFWPVFLLPDLQKCLIWYSFFG